MLTLIRTKYLIEIGGFDETMPAFQDWEAWLRLSKHYDVAYVNEPLALIYYDKSREHVLGSCTRIIKAYENIEAKNMDYLAVNPYAHWILLKSFIPALMLNGEYKKFFSLWLKMFHMQPRNKIGSILVIGTALRGLLSTRVKSLLFKMSPHLFYALKQLKLKHILKGEKTN